MQQDCTHFIEKQLPAHIWDMSPNELKVYLIALWLASAPTKVLVISTYRLSQKSNLYTKDVTQALKSLHLRGLIELELAQVPTEETIIKFIDSEKSSEHQIDPLEEMINESGNFVDESGEQEVYPQVASKNCIQKKTSFLSLHNVSRNVNKNNKYKLNNVRNDRNVHSQLVDKKSEQHNQNSKTQSPKASMAFHISKSLNDEKNLGLYLSYCEKYPDHVIFRAFTQVKDTPDSKIKKNRGALFTYLVKTLAQKLINEKDN